MAAYLIEVLDSKHNVCKRRIALTPGNAENWIDKFASKHDASAEWHSICEATIYGNGERWYASYTNIAIV